MRSALGRNEVAPTQQVIQALADALADDLNTPAAFGHLNTWVLATESGQTGGSTGEMARALDSLMGLAF